MTDAPIASLVLQALALGFTVLGAAMVLLFNSRQEKARSEARLDRLKQDLQIKTARLVVREARSRGEDPPPQAVEEAESPTSAEGQVGEGVSPPRRRLSRKAQDEQNAWDALRSMVELFCAIPDVPDLQDVRRLAKAECDRRLADWTEKTQAAYGARRKARGGRRGAGV